MITLRTTVIGRAQLNAALAGDGPAPVLASMVIGSDAPPDPATASASNLTPVQPAAQLVIARHTADIISGSAGFDAPASADVITWLALLYADGTPAAVGAIDGGLPRIPGLRLELTWAWASTDSGDLALDISIIDINALRAQLYNAVRADLDANNLGIAETRIKPVERAMHHVLRDGNPLMHLDLFADPYNLRGGNALAISGVIAGDDSIDLAEHTETLLSGDYLIFGSGNTETVRLLANLELGRRRLQSDILHTYPTATLSRTNWTITAGEAIAGAGQVYYSQPLELDATANRHQVLVRALTASGAPVVAVRTDDDDSDYQASVLERTRPAADGRAGWSDYIYDLDIDAPDVDGEMHLRVTTPATTRVSMISVVSDYLHRFACAPSAIDVIPVRNMGDGGFLPGQQVYVSVTLFPSSALFSHFLLYYNGRKIAGRRSGGSGSVSTEFVGNIHRSVLRNLELTLDDDPAIAEHRFCAIGVDRLNSRTKPLYREIPVVRYLHDSRVYTGSSGRGTLTIPAFVPKLTVTGHGSAGTAGSIGSNGEAAHIGVASIDNGPTGEFFWGQIPLGAESFYIGRPSYNMGGIARYVSPGIYHVAELGWVINTVDVAATPPLPATPGTAGTATTLSITGHDEIVFAGAAAGVTSVPADRTVDVTLPGTAETTTLTYSVPYGGRLEIRW